MLIFSKIKCILILPTNWFYISIICSILFIEENWASKHQIKNLCICFSLVERRLTKPFYFSKI